MRFLPLFFCVLLGFGVLRVPAEQQDMLDVLHYRITAELSPESNLLSATTTVTFRMLTAARSVVFEMNGSLKISKVKLGDRELQFVQDTLEALNVRVDFGEFVTAGQELSLEFSYEGKLASPEGGVLSNKRLAYIGPENGYLTYAARWFPFHGYASDTATYEIAFITSEGYRAIGFGSLQVSEYSPPVIAVPTETPPAKTPAKTPKKKSTTKGSAKRLTRNLFSVPEQPVFTSTVVTESQPGTKLILSKFVSDKAVLPGTFAFGRYTVEKATIGNVMVEFYRKPGNDAIVGKILEVATRALGFYVERFGEYAFGDRLYLVEIDNESLDFYTAAGITLLAEKTYLLKSEPELSEVISREVAYQWWGQAVILKSFDEAWLSQGLAQYSAMMLLETLLPEAVFKEQLRGYMERALGFEQQASIKRAPATLDDQSDAYRSIVFYKGAFVYRMLRLIIGEEKFQQLLRSFYEQYRNKHATIADFEAMASKVYGSDLRYFFGQWVDSTGVPEFNADYQILKTRSGGYRIRGTLSQQSESFRMPVDLEVVYEGGSERITLDMDGESADFNVLVNGFPKDVIVDPDNKLLKISDEIRVSTIVRRGIEHFRREEFPEAEEQFQQAIKLYRYSSWAWYNLGLLYFEQKNYQKALDTFAEALELDLRPRWVEVWSLIRRGQCYDALGNRSRAVAEYNKAAQTGDDYDGAQAVIAQYLAAPYRP